MRLSKNRIETINGNHTVHTRSWLREAGGYTEDGERVIVTDYNLVVNNEHGRRWVMGHTFRTEAEAEEVAALVTLALQKGCELIPEDWWEDDPVYGSDAYIEAEPEIAWRERQRDMEDCF